jgi:hypothetical protein
VKKAAQEFFVDNKIMVLDSGISLTFIDTE